ncbi:MAG TPA: MaoC family dehydratase [Mycobacterium sp.]
MTISPVVFATPADLIDGVGTALPITDWVVVDQHRIDTFATATGDHQWIHVDAERAKTGPYGRTVAHGYLTMSMVGPLIASVLLVPGASSVINYGLEKVRFPSPVLVESRIRLSSSTITAVDRVLGGVQVAIGAVLECEGSAKPACVCTVVYRFLD